MKIGLTYDLKPVKSPEDLPEDIFEEFDTDITIQAIKNNIEKLNFEVVLIGGGLQFLKRILREKIDFVFNISEGYGTRSREGHIPSVLEMLGIPYSGSDPLTLNITLDKEMCKRMVQTIGVKTPHFSVVHLSEPIENFHFNDYPCVVKLKDEGSSIGLRLSSKVNNIIELRKKLKEILSLYKKPVLIEKFISGPEITVGVIGNGNSARCLGLMEIRPKRIPVNEFLYSLEVKRNYKEEVEYIVPPEVSKSTIKKIEENALKIYKSLGCRDISRIDFRIGKNKEPYFLEVNPLPGLNPEYSDLPILVKKKGWSYEKLIKEILISAFSRYPALLKKHPELYEVEDMRSL